MDVTKLTWDEMACVVSDLWQEMKRRNPIGINFYAASMNAAYTALVEIAQAEKDHPTAEAGPGVEGDDHEA